MHQEEVWYMEDAEWYQRHNLLLLKLDLILLKKAEMQLMQQLQQLFV